MAVNVIEDGLGFKPFSSYTIAYLEEVNLTAFASDPAEPVPLTTTAPENSDAGIESVVALATALACIAQRY